MAKRSRFTEGQIIAALKAQKTGAAMAQDLGNDNGSAAGNAGAAVLEAGLPKARTTG